MTNLDRMKMLTLAIKDLDEAVKVYEKVKAKDRRTYAGYNIPMHCTKESIKRRITQMRQDLLLLEKEM